MEPIFETEFAEHSYGFRPGCGAKDALRRVATRLKAGHVWVVDADLKSFDTVNHDRFGGRGQVQSLAPTPITHHSQRRLPPTGAA